MKTIGIVLAYLIGAYVVVRAIVEVVTIDYGDSFSYEDDWGGPDPHRRARRALPTRRHRPRVDDLGRSPSPPNQRH